MQLPAHRVPAVEIARAGVGQGSAEAGGEEEELLQHFSQPGPLCQPFGIQGSGSRGQEKLPLHTASPILAAKSGEFPQEHGTQQCHPRGGLVSQDRSCLVVLWTLEEALGLQRA